MSKKRSCSNNPPFKNEIIVLPINEDAIPAGMPFFCLAPLEALRPFDLKYAYVPYRTVDAMTFLILRERLAGKIVVDETGMVLAGEKKLGKYDLKAIPVMKICGFSLRKKRAFREAYSKF